MTTTPRRSTAGRATLEMVAERAGVSRGTASRVLSGAPNVSERAVEAVTRAAAELAYRPNLSARSLVTGRHGLVGLVVNETNDTLFSDPYFARVARGAHAALSEADVALVLALAADDRERDRLVDLAALRLDGLLVVHGHGDPQLVESLVGAGVPTVFAGRTSTAATQDLWWVDSDNASGAQAAVEHLLARGRRRIAHISGPLDMVAGQDRIEGWRIAHEVAAVEVDPALMEPGNFSTESGRVAMQALLARVPDLDAVFAANDLMAIGALQVLREAGREVPDEVALVGFDDIDAASHTAPPLTTVAQDIDAMGRRLAQLLLVQLGGDVVPQREVIPTELVVRASS